MGSVDGEGVMLEREMAQSLGCPTVHPHAYYLLCLMLHQEGTCVASEGLPPKLFANTARGTEGRGGCPATSKEFLEARGRLGAGRDVPSGSQSCLWKNSLGLEKGRARADTEQPWERSV